MYRENTDCEISTVCHCPPLYSKQSKSGFSVNREVISLLQYFKIQTKLTTGMSTLLLHASCLETFQRTTFKTFFTIFTQLLPLLCHTSTKQHIYWWTSSSVTFQNIFHWNKNQRFPSRNSSIFLHYFCMHMYVVT